MAAPHNKAMNPDAQALLEQLLANPAKAECPICAGVGFWDNRADPKRPEKAPHWKCKNKDCVGATPMKAKRPYGVWLPDDYEDAPAPQSRRAAMGLPANAAAAQREVPPPKDEDFHDMMRDTPPAEDYPTKQPPVAPTVRRMDEYFDLARKVAAFQAEVSKASKDGIPYDFSSVNAMTFSIWNTR